MVDTSSTIKKLCDWYIDSMRHLDNHAVYGICHLLLCARDLNIDTPRTRMAIKKLEHREPPIDSGEDLLQAVLRQIVFTRFGKGLDSRQRFLDYWINKHHFRKTRDLLSVSFLINLALLNQNLVTNTILEYVRLWHLKHKRIKSYQASAWAVYCVDLVEDRKQAQEWCNELMAKREKNGSWDNNLRLTVACLLPLVLSKLVLPDQINSSIVYVFDKIGRGYAYGIATNAMALRLAHLLRLMKKSDYTLIAKKLHYDGSVFLSHNKRDKPFVNRLAQDLAKANIFVWLDDAEIKIGDSLIEKISQALDYIDYVIAVISTNSATSEWVKKELDIALNREIKEKKIKVLTVLIEQCELPVFLVGKKYADFINAENYSSSLQSLIEKIKE